MSLLDTASLIVTPNGYKEGKLYSVIPSDGSGDMSVTRATTATRVNSAGLVELVPYNLLSYSEQIDNGYWSKYQSTITANNTTAPNGTLTADRLTQNGAGAGTFYVTPSAFNGGLVSLSCFYKKGIGNVGWLEINKGAESCYIQFNLDTQVISASGNYLSTNIENVGNGWYRCSVVSNQSAGTANYVGFGNIGNNGDTIFAWGAQLNEGTIKDYQKTETRLNIPRLDYSNGTCPSLLVEPQRTNLALYSEQFDNAAWEATNANVTSNVIISPSGVQNADLLQSIDTNAPRIRQTTTQTGNNVFTFSCFAKKGNVNFLILRNIAVNVGGGSRAWFNLDTGVVGTVNAGLTASIESVGSGWYRCSISGTTDSSPLNLIDIALSATDNTFAGAANENIYLWGAQLEAGSYATSYIPTQGASVTRNADVISKTGISSLIGSSEYTLFWNGKHIVTGEYNSFATCYQASNNNNSVRFYRNNSNNAIRAALFNVSSGLSLDLNSGITTENAKCALRVKAGDYAFFVNGSLVASSASALAPSSSLDALNIQYFDASQSFQQELKGLAFWKTALTNTQLATLTTL